MTPSIGQLVRGLVAATVILGAIVGLPILLLALGANPLHVLDIDWPSWEEVREYLFTQDYGLYRLSALLSLLFTVFGWVIWAWFTVLTVCEFVEQLRYLHRPLPPGAIRAGIVRGAVAGLVSAVLLLSTPSTSAASNPAPAVSTSQLANPPAPVGFIASITAPSVASTPHEEIADELPRYTVHLGDTLWGLAQRYLGDGLRWRQIHDLNRAAIPDPDFLDVGAVLRMPSDAVLPPPPADAGPGARRITVAPGDTLTGIAARELADPAAATRLWEINHSRTQPDGRAMTHPDRLLPGWRLWIPATTPQARQPPQDAPAPSVAPVVPPTAPRTPNAPQRPTEQSQNGQHGPSATPESAPPSPPPAQPPVTVRPVEGTEQPGLELGPGAVVSAGLVAAVAAAVVAARVRHRRRRRAESGNVQRYEPPPVVGELHAAMHRRVVAAMDDDEDEQDDGAPGWALSPNGDAPTIPIGPPLPAWPPWQGSSSTGDSADPRAVTVPGLPLAPSVTLGRTAAGELVLELDRCGGLGLTGPGALPAARALLTALLGAAGPGRPFDQARVVSPSEDARRLLGEQAGRFHPGRWELVDDLPAALSYMSGELEHRRRLLRDTDATDRADVRVRYRAETFTELVLVGTPAPTEAPALRQVLEDGAEVGLSAVLLGAWPTGLTCHVGEDGVVDHAECPAAPELADAMRGQELYRLPAPSAAQLVELFDSPQDSESEDTPEPAGESHDTDTEAASSGRPPTHAEAQLPDTQAANPVQPAGTAVVRGPQPRAVDVELPPGYTIGLRGLGGLRVYARAGGNTNELDPGQVYDVTAVLRPKHLLLLSCLMLKPEPIATSKLLEWGWTDKDPDVLKVRLHSTLTAIRTRLRKVTAGNESVVSATDEHHYRLDPHVWVDFWEFLASAKVGRESADPVQRLAALQRATTLYQGPLLPELIAGPALSTRLDTIEDASNVALQLTDLVGQDEPERAVALLRAALREDPAHEGVGQALVGLLRRLGRAQQAAEVEEELARQVSGLTAGGSPRDTKRPPSKAASCPAGPDRAANKTRRA